MSFSCRGHSRSWGSALLARRHSVLRPHPPGPPLRPMSSVFPGGAGGGGGGKFSLRGRGAAPLPPSPWIDLPSPCFALLRENGRLCRGRGRGGGLPDEEFPISNHHP